MDAIVIHGVEAQLSAISTMWKGPLLFWFAVPTACFCLIFLSANNNRPTYHAQILKCEVRSF